MAKRYEGSAADKRADKAGAKTRGMTLKAFEKSTADKGEDRAGQRRMRKGKR